MANVVVKFLGDKDQLSRTIGSIKQESQGIGGGFTRAAAGLKSMALPALGAATAVFKLAQNAGKTADALFDMQDQTGVSTDKLQEMRYVADQAGVTQDFYANSVKEVIKAQDELQRGTGPASEAMERLGVAVQNVDGSMRSAEAITDDVFKSLSAIEDPTLRAALAQDVFKRKFEDVLPVLGLGTAALADLRGEAHDLGAVQSGEALEAANEYRQGMEKLQTALQDLVNRLLEDLLPAITDYVIPALDWLVTVVGRAADGFDDLVDLFMGSIPAVSDFKSNIRGLSDSIDKTGESARISGGRVRGLTDAINESADAVRKATDPAFALRDAQEKFVEASQKVDDVRATGATRSKELIDALADESEAQADLNYATEQYEAAGSKAEEGLFNLGIQAGQTREEIELLIGSLERLGEVPVGDISIGVQTDLGDLYDLERDLAIRGGSRRVPL